MSMVVKMTRLNILYIISTIVRFSYRNNIIIVYCVLQLSPLYYIKLLIQHCPRGSTWQSRSINSNNSSWSCTV